MISDNILKQSSLIQSSLKQRESQERMTLNHYFKQPHPSQLQHNSANIEQKNNISQLLSQQNITNLILGSKNSRQNICQHCNKAFIKNAHLLRHITERHSEVRSFVCKQPQCEKTFKRDSHLRRHIISHTHEKPFKCSQCIMSFGYKHHLDRHIKSVHEKVLIQCKQCEQKFFKKKALTRHMQKVHKKKNSKKTQTQNSNNNENKSQSKFNKSHQGNDWSISQQSSFNQQDQIQSNEPKPNKNKKIRKSRSVDHGKQKKNEKISSKQKLMFRCIYQQCISAFDHKHKLVRHLKTIHKEQYQKIYEQQKQSNENESYKKQQQPVFNQDQL